MIPLFRPTAGEAEAREVARVLASGWLGTGPETLAFEREFAAYIGVEPEQCIATNSCTSALRVAVELTGCTCGLVPALTFVADAEVVDHPAPVDVDPVTLCASEPCLIHVHYAGLPSAAICFIEDCAHAMGARRHRRHVGTSARFGCFSFHAVKNLATGDGGMLVCNDPEDADAARALCWHGIERDTYQRTDRQAYSWEYGIGRRGCKGRMNDIAAAIGRVQLRRLDASLERRAVIAARYSAELRGVALPPGPPPGCRHAWHLYVVRHTERDRLIGHLKARGIQAGVHYRPWTETEAYAAPTPPVTAAVWPTLVSLPMYPGMTEAEQDEVIRAVNEFAG